MDLIKDINNTARKEQIIEPVEDDKTTQKDNGKSVSDYLNDIQNKENKSEKG